MNNASLPVMLMLGLAVAGCANTGAKYQPINDGPKAAGYAADLSDCQALATERSYTNGDMKTDAVIGAGIGAIAGLADDDVSDTEGLIAGAIVGAVAGGGVGMVETREQRRKIVIECMQGRGHPVVG